MLSDKEKRAYAIGYFTGLEFFIKDHGTAAQLAEYQKCLKEIKQSILSTMK